MLARVPDQAPDPAALDAVTRRLGASPHRLSATQVSRFWQDGVLGPLPCGAPQLQGLLDQLLHASTPSALSEAMPGGDGGGKRNLYDPQQHLPSVRELARHASIVHPVAQLLGSAELSFFQARFRVKAPQQADPQPWHQDVGSYHGGLFLDGSPIPSLTVWLSLDGADAASGGVVALPGSHRQLLGNWPAGFHGLRELQTSLDTSQARILTTPAHHFQIFHSWTVHCSLSNSSPRRRSALILRYMPRRHAVDVSFHHDPCGLS
jgi:ectoine hydroxylase-related dioxygenase (phytanoyl-CoA dioxygenase family)